MTEFTVTGRRVPSNRGNGMETQVLCNDKPLDLHLEYCDHSPTGFEWGFVGSGPAQLAFSILFEYLVQVRGMFPVDAANLANQLYQGFKWKHIANLPTPWEIHGDLIESFLEERRHG